MGGDAPVTNIRSTASGQTSPPDPSLSSLRCLRWGVRVVNIVEEGVMMGVLGWDGMGWEGCAGARRVVLRLRRGGGRSRVGQMGERSGRGREGLGVVVSSGGVGGNGGRGGRGVNGGRICEP